MQEMSLQQLHEWIKSNQQLTNSVQTVEIRQIFKVNVNIYEKFNKTGKQSRNIDEVITEISSNMVGLAKIRTTCSHELASVSNMILSITKVCLQAPNCHNLYPKFWKIEIQFMKLNIASINSNQIHLSCLYESICSDIEHMLSCPTLTAENITTLVIQSKILEGMRGALGETLEGVDYVVLLIVRIHAGKRKQNETDQRILKVFDTVDNIVLSSLKLPNFADVLFNQIHQLNNPEMIESFYEICCSIILQLKNESADVDPQICVKFIESLTSDHQIIGLSFELQDRIVTEIVELMQSRLMSAKSFKFIEKFIFHSIFSVDHDNYWLRWICSNIFYKYLDEMKSREYLQYYQKILSRLREKLSIFYNNSSIDLMTFELANFLDKLLHLIRLKLNNESSQSSQLNYQNDFLNTYELLKRQPTNQTFNRFLQSSALLSSSEFSTSNEKLVKFLCEILSSNIFWTFNDDMTCLLLNIITSTKDHKVKIQFLVKLASSLNSEKSIKVKLKFIEMLLSFFELPPHYSAVRSVVSGEIRKLLKSENDVITKFLMRATSNNSKARDIIDSISQQNDEASDSLAMEVDENLTEYRRSQEGNSQSSESNVADKINAMLLFSRELNRENLSRNDLIKIEEICRNLTNKAKR